MITGVLSDESLRKVRTQARVWFLVTRPKFLLGSVVLAVLGTSIAWWDGSFSALHAVLAFVGFLLWHVSVNVLNEYFDYRTGIDLETRRTPFSGGSGILPAGLLRAESVFKLGLLCFALAVPIWAYFVIVKGVMLLPLLAAAAICFLLYAPLLTRLGLGEIAASYGIGIFPVLAFYFVQAGGYPSEVVVVAILAAILVFNLHVLNEFPDMDADKVGGRRTLTIALGRRRASWVYLAGTVAVYAWVGAWVAVGIMPQATLLSLATIPLALRAVTGALTYRDETRFIPVLWASAIAYFATLALLALGYIVDRL
ncbi:MAG: prenyltransferase [Dehalococcoidia bacterium]